MTTLVVLAQHAVTEKTWWNPYLKGALIAALAIGLFVGSAYLLLYTNVGSRLGFLLTAAAFTGVLAFLPLFWIANEFVTGPKGRLPGWPVKEMVSSPSESRYGAVRDIETSGAKAETAQAAQIRAQLDLQLTDKENRFKRFDKATDFVVNQTYTRGGGRKWPWFWSENTTYGAAEVCPAAEPDVLPLAPPPTPECDTAKDTEWAIVIEDLGAQRLPQFFFLGGFSLLFGLTLLALHRYEQEMEPRAEEPEPAEPEPAEPEPSESPDPEPANA